MSRYRKSLVAVAGAGLQLLAFAATAADSGLVPESWRPWATVVIALATAAGVYRVPNAPGRHESPAEGLWAQSGRQW